MSKELPKVEVPLQMIGASQVPFYAKHGDAGFDLRLTRSVSLQPGQKDLISAGFKIAIPDTYKDFGLFGLVVPRSSSGKLQVGLANTVGIIDSGYRGEILMYVKNIGNWEAIKLEKDQAVMQMILVPYVRAEFTVMDFLEETERASGGFGHSGK